MCRRFLQRYFPKPDQAVDDVSCIDVEKLNQCGYKLLLVDLDNTLAQRKSNVLSNEARIFLAEAKKYDMVVVLVTNTVYGRHRQTRVESLADQHGLSYVCASFPWLKPHPKPFLTAMNNHHYSARQTVMIGDQCRTDGRGAKSLGIFFIKVKPSGDDHWATSISRLLENMALRCG